MKFAISRGLIAAVLSSGFFAALPSSGLATVQINLAAGYLRGQGGTTALVPNSPNSTPPVSGSLLLLVAANQTTNTFTNQLTAGNYVSGGDTILASFAFNNFGGASGTGQTTTNSLNFTLPTTVTAGSTLVELRWFPTISLSQYPGTSPATGTTYGVYNPSLYPAVNGTTLNPDGGSNWVVPTDGTTGYALDFFTTDTGIAGAKQAAAEGYAGFTVVVPEPSSGILSGLTLVLMAGAVRLWRRSVAA